MSPCYIGHVYFKRCSPIPAEENNFKWTYLNIIYEIFLYVGYVRDRLSSTLNQKSNALESSFITIKSYLQATLI